MREKLRVFFLFRELRSLLIIRSVDSWKQKHYTANMAMVLEFCIAVLVVDGITIYRSYNKSMDPSLEYSY